MKSILTIFLILINLILITPQSPAPYCPVSYSNVPCNSPGPSQSPGNGVNDFIHSFNTTGALQNISNNNSGCNGNPNNYIRYNCNQHYLKVQPGQVITCNVQSGITFAQGFAVFIDWNQNNVFDIPAERVAATPGVPAAGSFSAITFTVPAGQATGQYRMRVRCAYATAGINIGPCQLYGFGETEDYDVFVNMNPTPVGGTAISNATGVCPGQTVTLSLQGQNGTIQWQSASSPNGPWTNIPGATTSPYTTQPLNASTCYQAILSACNTTQTSSVVCVTLGQLPQLTINNPIICQGDSTTLTLFATPSGGTYLWSTGQTTQSIVVSPTSTSTYTVTYDLGGCIQTASVVVTVNPNPAVSITGVDSICLGQSTTLTASQSVNYLWNTGETTQNITVTPTASTTYTVGVINANGCTASASINIVVNPLPQPSFISTAVCNGMMTDLVSTSSITSGNIVGYNWISGSGLIGNSNPLQYVFPNAGTFPVTLVVTSDNGCTSSITQNVVVNANPVVNFNASQTIGCDPLCVSLMDMSTVAGSTLIDWIWTVDGQQVSTLPVPNNICFNTPGVYDIGLVVTSAQGCTGSLTITDYITVNPTPIASFVIPSDSIPLSNATIFFANQSLNATNYSWNFDDSTTSTEFSPIHTFDATGLYCIQLTAYGAPGCVSTASQCIYIYSEFFVYVPNTFTPDADGLNEVFGVKGVGLKTVQMSIYNRWGQMIFQSVEGNQNTAIWNGLLQDGRMAEQGVYTYHITVMDNKNQIHNFYGRVHLIN